MSGSRAAFQQTRKYNPHIRRETGYSPASHLRYAEAPTRAPSMPPDRATQQKRRLMREFGWTEDEFDSHIYEDEQFMELLLLNDCAHLASRLYDIPEAELDDSVMHAKHIVFNEAFRMPSKPEMYDQILEKMESGRNGIGFWWTSPRREVSSLEENHPLLAMKTVIHSAQQHVRVAMAYWDNVRDGIIVDISQKLESSSVMFDIRVGGLVRSPKYQTSQRRDDGSIIKAYDYSRGKDMPLKNRVTIDSELKRLERTYGERIQVRGFPGSDSGIGHWKYVSADSKYSVVGTYNDTEAARDRNNESAVSIVGEFEHFAEGFKDL